MSQDAVYAFLFEKRARSGSTRTVTTVYLRRLEGEADWTWPDVALGEGLSELGFAAMAPKLDDVPYLLDSFRVFANDDRMSLQPQAVRVV